MKHLREYRIGIGYLYGLADIQYPRTNGFELLFKKLLVHCICVQSIERYNGSRLRLNKKDKMRLNKIFLVVSEEINIR